MNPLPCAIYTRKSSEEGLDQDFNSLDAQRDRACDVPTGLTLLCRQRWHAVVLTRAHRGNPVSCVGQQGHQCAIWSPGLRALIPHDQLYLAFLAPDLVETIARAEQPVGMGVTRLVAMSPLPMDWAEQRRVFGLA